jgi:DNA mismatch endonuclease (patch repair protein)
MADIVPPEVRSRMMAGIRGRDTKPELMLRKGLYAAGFRYRLHVKDLPGRPDMVFPRHRAVLFAHGCFWHGHDCHLFRWPSSRQDWWREKITRNRAVDVRSEAALAEAGWRLGVVWECALKGRTRLPLLDVLEACAAWLRSDAPRLEVRGAA